MVLAIFISFLFFFWIACSAYASLISWLPKRLSLLFLFAVDYSPSFLFLVCFIDRAKDVYPETRRAATLEVYTDISTLRPHASRSPIFTPQPEIKNPLDSVSFILIPSQ